jgi:hypothetical protein
VIYLAYIGGVRKSRAESLEEVINNVRANEELYKNIDMTYERHYTLVMRPRKDDDPNTMIRSSTTTNHYIFQGELHYEDHREKAAVLSGKETLNDHLAGFDGQITRSLFQEAVANITSGDVPCNAPRPHTLLFAYNHFKGALSAYLAAATYENKAVTTIVLGAETVAGHDCVRLRCEARNANGKLRSIRLLDLARDRNYLPIRKIGFATSYSDKVPLEIDTADDFREIAPGIWLPYQVKIVVNEEIAASRGETVPYNTTDYTITECKLDPHYDVSFFRNIRIPDGTRIHEVTNGKITKSYVQGAKPEAAGAKWYLWLIAIVNLILLCLLGRYLYRRWQRRSIARASAF